MFTFAIELHDIFPEGTYQPIFVSIDRYGVADSRVGWVVCWRIVSLRTVALGFESIHGWFNNHKSYVNCVLPSPQVVRGRVGKNR